MWGWGMRALCLGAKGAGALYATLDDGVHNLRRRLDDTPEAAPQAVPVPAAARACPGCPAPTPSPHRLPRHYDADDIARSSPDGTPLSIDFRDGPGHDWSPVADPRDGPSDDDSHNGDCEPAVQDPQPARDAHVQRADADLEEVAKRNAFFCKYQSSTVACIALSMTGTKRGGEAVISVHACSAHVDGYQHCSHLGGFQSGGRRVEDWLLSI
mmetsp:Transcript_3291/g.9552  ORF Transcript_3291/g.9552 Transcript_3291/m.9552 type:complete len:212 (-) Transcript_3291:1563-2198(-)